MLFSLSLFTEVVASWSHKLHFSLTPILFVSGPHYNTCIESMYIILDRQNRFAIITVSFQMTNQFTAESRLINLPLAIF